MIEIVLLMRLDGRDRSDIGSNKHSILNFQSLSCNRPEHAARLVRMNSQNVFGKLFILHRSDIEKRVFQFYQGLFLQKEKRILFRHFINEAACTGAA
jgi:hypothetical protein